jgi:hypothetical protein
MNETLKDKYRAAKVEFDASIAKTMLENPTKSYRAIARQFCVSVDWVITVAKQYGVKRSRGRKPGIPNLAGKGSARP